ncbi:Calcineurin-like phosphoesterase [Singulisphaera sp. GP187]|uniref:metallophosphoesterase family protein n=1 Tax=Singulisphaera sp. GP187 TaxID=1882752 RepID=UPI000927142A|nr:metallophosphoesterase [Singulisphaera sp. GP187]SIO20026.1 Calcineurin-like phosphoesterase [Singulisphaera sp. GP187]
MHGIPHLPPGQGTPVNSSRFSKPRRPFGDPVASTKSTPRFIPPPFTNFQNLSLPLDVVLRSSEEEKRIEAAGKLVFHCVGDTGGIHGTAAQEAIAHAMEAQIQSAATPDRAAFFYHLGDVVYFNGLRELYEVQFYDPYKYYPAPIFAIPGNHDGDTITRPGDEPDHETTLAGFLENFCASSPKHVSTYRETMTQPYVYWTLEAPFATIIGLYSNVDGSLDGRGTIEQQRWFEGQIRSAPAEKCLIVAVHHPPYSLDADHGGSPAILAAVERASSVAGRWPDAVFSGHVHNYQRFTRVVEERKIPFVVAGAGGYADQPKALHQLQLDMARHPIPAGRPFQTTAAGVVLECYQETNPGFLRISIDADTLTGEYFLVPFDDPPPDQPVDSFRLNWKTHQLVDRPASAAHVAPASSGHGHAKPRGK